MLFLARMVVVGAWILGVTIIQLFIRFGVFRFFSSGLLLYRSVVSREFVLVAVLSISFSSVARIYLAMVGTLRSLGLYVIVARCTSVRDG